MPTVLRSGPYRAFFYAGDRDEPPHVHVERDRSKAKYWLEPVALVSSSGFSRGEGRIPLFGVVLGPNSSALSSFGLGGSLAEDFGALQG
jgi:hypothetical protein